MSVTRIGDGDPIVFDACVREGKSETRHRVTLARADFVRLNGGATAEALIESAFRFLLDREPKESILAHFDVSVIGRYFPEFEEKLPDYFR
ncbi:hypothetical protein F7D14_07585 [Methylocystis parvus]|uniref:Uncharacterized protein n=1 Tax=Methylocystis parvus TaxID=134 RepID=A0A6B8MDG7_9HYPH|nr:hypothetical protein F7D14_07585 [Methylocystis parvus]